MILFPAIDLYGGQAVRLLRGDYRQMTVYSDRPAEVALAFAKAGATHMHMVDLEGAKTGERKNLSTVREAVSASGLFTEIGGGIRDEAAIEAYLSVGVSRVILGTAAVENPSFVEEMVKKYGEAIAVGIDILDGAVAVRGWVEKSSLTCDELFSRIEEIGVKTAICTDISKDGALSGTNRELYRTLSKKYRVNVVASGGVSSLSDIRELSGMGLYGAIVGKAYYTGALDLHEALKAAKA